VRRYKAGIEVDTLPGTIVAFLNRIIALVIAITVHEFAHAWTAHELGDPTSKHQGRLTLNPLAHLDPIGSLMILVARFGWGKPVPVNPYMLRTDPTVGMALVSVAGPLSNIITAFLFALPIRFGALSLVPVGMTGVMVDLLGSIIIINLVLAIFNMIPLAPLDGYKVALALLPADLAHRVRQVETYGPLILILLIFLPSLIPGFNLLGMVLGPPIDFLCSLVTGRSCFAF
jgi:Zn-dependent protease